jgi:hypothetical protein
MVLAVGVGDFLLTKSLVIDLDPGLDAGKPGESPITPETKSEVAAVKNAYRHFSSSLVISTVHKNARSA